MKRHLRLGVNIDHVATIRNARGGRHPDPVRAARLAENAGADGITAHLREDRRHISDDDIARLMRELTRAGMHSRTLMEWVLRIMANLLRPDEVGPAEAAYRAASALVRFAPNA